MGRRVSKPEEIAAAIRRIRSLTDRPFNINLFAGGYETDRKIDPRPMLEIMSEAHAKLGLPPPVLPPVPRNPFDAQLEAVLEERPPIFSFTFGIPSSAQIAALKKRGIAISGSATTVEEARRLAQAGVDAIVAQGAEAGAHRGTFAAAFEESMVPLATLVRGICGITALPVIASGGLMDGRDIAAARKLGAAAVQLGTAFLPCPESGAPAVYKRALLSATTGHDCHHPRLFGTAGARSEQSIHRHGERQGALHSAVPPAERSHPADAQCLGPAGRGGLCLVVGRAGGRALARNAGGGFGQNAGRGDVQPRKSSGRSSIGAPCGVRSQACSQASRVRASCFGSVTPFSERIRSSVASQ